MHSFLQGRGFEHISTPQVESTVVFRSSFNIMARGTHRRKKVEEKSCVIFLLCDPGWYVQRTCVQNEWEENTHTHTSSTLLYSSIIRLYPQNPVFEIVHDESVKVYLHMYNGNVQQNPLCVESCVTMYSFYPRSHCR